MNEVMVFLKKVGEPVFNPVSKSWTEPGICIEDGIIKSICVEFDRNLTFNEDFYKSAERIINDWMNSTDDHKSNFREMTGRLQQESRMLCQRVVVFRKERK